jgi:hypothetical protein
MRWRWCDIRLILLHSCAQCNAVQPGPPSLLCQCGACRNYPDYIGTYQTVASAGTGYGSDAARWAFHGYNCIDPWSPDGYNCVRGWGSANCASGLKFMCEIPQRAFPCYPPPSPPPPPPNPPSPPRPPQPPMCECRSYQACLALQRIITLQPAVWHRSDLCPGTWVASLGQPYSVFCSSSHVTCGRLVGRHAMHATYLQAAGACLLQCCDAACLELQRGILMDSTPHSDIRGCHD